MKILFLAPYAPVPPTFGGALRIYHLLKQAVQRHDVSLVAYGGDAEYKMLKEHFGNALRQVCLLPYPWPDRFRRVGQLYAFCTRHSFFHHLIYSDQMQQFIDYMLESESFDLIQSEFAVMGSFTIQSDALKVLDSHNVEYDNFLRMSKQVGSFPRRLHYRQEYKKFFHEEIDACKKQDAIFVTSQRDMELLHHHVASVPKFIVPNGVDVEFFASGRPMPKKNSIVFTGMMGYVPNYDGMEYFLEKIFPLVLRRVPDASVTIVGKNPPKSLLAKRSANVIITGFVPDVRPYMDAAAVYVVPLRMGGGTRLKILEAMAMKIPVVTTSIGCEGIDVADDESALVRDDPGSFADAVVQMLTDRRTAERLAANGQELVHARYDWNIIGAMTDRYYTAITADRRSIRAGDPVPQWQRTEEIGYQHAG